MIVFRALRKERHLVEPTVRPNARFTNPPTSESEWRRFVAGLPEFDQATPAAALVVAPHPDDETLALGGTLATWADAGTAITVVAVTDGEGSHPGRPGLAAQRVAEQTQALRALGVRDDPVRLGLPDTGVTDQESELTQLLAPHVQRLADAGQTTGETGVVVAPWDHDAHTDHDAVGRAATLAARRCGLALLAYPVWAWQWAVPTDFAGLDVRRHRLGVDARSRKALAEAAFVSQTTSLDGAEPILSAQFRERFRRSDEVLIVSADA